MKTSDIHMRAHTRAHTQHVHTHSIEGHTLSELVNMLTIGRGWCPRRGRPGRSRISPKKQPQQSSGPEKQACLQGRCVNQTLKWKRPDEEVGACLAACDHMEGYGSRTEW